MHWFSIVLLLSHVYSIQTEQNIPLLLFISLHGFRSDYSKLHGPLANFNRLAQRGVHTPSMIPTFNTAKIPNHYTMMTGLYEEVHGIVSDEVYDPEKNRLFRSWNDTTDDWWSFTQMWTVNEDRNYARSAVIGWPQNYIKAFKTVPYDKDRSLRSLFDEVLRLFNDQQKPINFGVVHFDQPGATGYKYGPYSNKTREIVRQCDEDLGYLLDEIDRNPRLRNNLHLIVTSDHGLEQVNDTKQAMLLDDYVNMTQIKAFGTETVVNIFLQSGSDLTTVMKALARIPHTRVYRPEDIPPRFHYKTHRNIGDLVIFVDVGFELYRRASQYDRDGIFRSTHGNSGYDNQHESMKTIFYASGPQLRENYLLPAKISIETVDLFPLMCTLLNVIRCPSSNGSLSRIQSIFLESARLFNVTEKENEKLQDGPMGLIIYLLVLVSFVLMLIMGVVWSAVAFRQLSPNLLTNPTDPNTIAEQNQYKFTQIHDRKLNAAIGNDNL